MRQAAPEWYDLARQLLAHEAGGRHYPTDLADAAQSACRKLYQQLAALIGPEGFRVLIARALHLAAIEVPSLKGVEVEPQGSVRLKGLQESVQGLDLTEASRGLAVLLANFISLLSTFIGKDLALRQVRRAWPEVPLRTGYGFEEVKE